MKARRLLAIVLLLAAPAEAAPICLNRAGDAVHCDSQGAMPLGWTLPPEEASRRRQSHPPPPVSEILKALGGLVLFFALIALMPEFDGARDQDWDSQEKRDPE